MQPAVMIEEVLPDVFRWEQYSPAHKVNLTSHAIIREGRIFVFDPIALVAEPMALLAARGSIAAIVLTNDNHERDAASWRDRCDIPIWAADEASLPWPGVRRFHRAEQNWEGWKLEWLDGAAGGELAFRWNEQSLVVCGDAIVNLPDRGLELLPEKYCRNQSQLKQSVRNWVAVPFERLLMAHGLPLMEEASQRVARLVSDDVDRPD
ncbi:MAG: hypothetical protein H7X97_01970 [Opitutaceae bacterium]|nr:hypothetical protein [Verrucomicrobiales bacterium]